MTTTFEDLLRDLTPQVLGALVRRYGQFDACEDAVQEALLAAATQWPAEGVPDNPRGWLITVASRRLTDQLRSDIARRRREEAYQDTSVEPPSVPDQDDTLVLLFMCCHPALSRAVAARAHAAGGRRAQHGRDRERVHGARDDDGAADQPGQAEDQVDRHPVPAAARGRAGRAAPRRPAGPVPDLQRGVHGDIRRRPAPARPHRRGDPAHAGVAARYCPRTARSPGCSRSCC